MLTIEDEAALRDAVDELSKRMMEAMESKQYVAAAAALKQMTQLEIIGNAFVTKLIGQAEQQLSRQLVMIERTVTGATMRRDFGEAEGMLQELRDIKSALDIAQPSFESWCQHCASGDVDLSDSDSNSLCVSHKQALVIGNLEEMIAKRKEEARCFTQMKEKMTEMADTKQQLELKLELVTQQEKAKSDEVKRLNDMVQQSKESVEQDRVQLGESFDEQIGKLEDLIKECSTEELPALKQRQDELMLRYKDKQNLLDAQHIEVMQSMQSMLLEQERDLEKYQEDKDEIEKTKQEQIEEEHKLEVSEWHSE